MEDIACHSPEPPRTIFTIGHSTRALSEFMDLLREAQIELLVDVRSVPRSRTNPQFNVDALPEALATAGIGYVHLSTLGGLRHRRKTAMPSTNALWQNASFRNYADYAGTEAFRGSRGIGGAGSRQALRHHVRRSRVVALPPPNHRGLPAGSWDPCRAHHGVPCAGSALGCEG